MHWKVQQRFEKNRKDSENGIVESLELARKVISVHLFHEFDKFKLDGKWDDENGNAGKFSVAAPQMSAHEFDFSDVSK